VPRNGSENSFTPTRDKPRTLKKRNYVNKREQEMAKRKNSPIIGAIWTNKKAWVDGRNEKSGAEDGKKREEKKSQTSM